nr:MAG TPA: hypothetical protein [Caudoviricetes sp.]
MTCGSVMMTSSGASAGKKAHGVMWRCFWNSRAHRTTGWR